MYRTDWRDDAACADPFIDPDLFFPVGAPKDDYVSEARLLQEEEAKQICRSCPVVEKCLTMALNGGLNTSYGVWGGLTDRERRNLKRRQRERAAA